MVARCIYCGRYSNPKRGEGDHVFAAQLFGLFKGDKRFRGICRTCNNLCGRMEQEVIQTSHLGFYRFLVRPKLGRAKRAGSLVPCGVSRETKPSFTVETDGRFQLLELSDDHPDMGIVVDQLQILDADGSQYQVRLYSGMTVDQLRKAIEQSGSKKPKTWWINCSERTAPKLQTLVAKVLKASKTEELPRVEVGVYEGHTVATFNVRNTFYRSLAKIAFHYYLLNSERGLQGNEPEFVAVRRFIRRGDSDFSAFFKTTGTKFATPFGKVASGGMVCPANWCHIIAMSEVEGHIVVYLQLYVGPRSVPDPHYITLGAIQSRIIMPCAVVGHVYEIQPNRRDKYAGEVSPLSLTRVQ